MRTTATLLLCLFAGAGAQASECGRWSAAMQEDEGGPQMTARVCVGAGQALQDFSVQCGGDGTLSLRYLPAASTNYPPGEAENFEADLTLSLDRETFTRRARFEAMDGAMAMTTKIGDSLVEALMHGETFVLSDADGKLPGIAFPLRGSRQALVRLIGSCAR
ncbi:MAG: hypothetical protein KDJ87_12575 [Rhizobiaceae bacterium]|nr:hypothetical protein [Rhizobiaceae bacterium]